VQEILKEIAIKKNMQSRIVIEDWLLTELAYTSNAIEGNTLTGKEINRIITQNITTGSNPIKDYLDAKNRADAFKLVLKLSKNIQKIILSIFI
jgi:Fic family protein